MAAWSHTLAKDLVPPATAVKAMQSTVWPACFVQHPVTVIGLCQVAARGRRVRFGQRGVRCEQTEQASAHLDSGVGRRVDVLQPHLAADRKLAILGTGDDDLPQLLGAALLDRLGDHVEAALTLRPQEVGHVGDPDGKLPAVLDGLEGPGGGNRLDDRGEDTAVHQAPWLMVLGPTSNQPATRSPRACSRCNPSRRMNARWPSSSAVALVDAAIARALQVEGSS